MLIIHSVCNDEPLCMIIYLYNDCRLVFVLYYFNLSGVIVTPHFKNSENYATSFQNF